jgi:multiple sugar transport system permease protein
VNKDKFGMKILIYFILFIFLLWTIIPILLMVSTSFKKEMDIFSIPFVFSFKPTLQNYVKAFQTGEFSRYFLNSTIISICSAGLSVILGALAAYGIVSFDLKYARIVSNVFILGKLVPSITILIPFFIILAELGLLGTYAGPILAHVALNLPFVVWLFMGFIKDIPKEIEAAALIDGASRMKSFWLIIFPLLTPALASATVLSMQLSWNELLFSMQLTNLNTYTLPVGISRFVGSISVDWGKSSAAATVCMIPMIIAGFFIQDYIVKGMTMGSVKG